MATFNQKLSISLASAGLFALVNLPCTYNFTNKLSNDLLKINLYDDEKRCPSNVGLIVHALVFLLITYASMHGSKQPDGVKWKHSIYGALIFYLVSSPAVYSLINRVLGERFSTKEGCPKNEGIILHSLVYASILLGVMYLPESCSVINLNALFMPEGSRGLGRSRGMELPKSLDELRNLF